MMKTKKKINVRSSKITLNDLIKLNTTIRSFGGYNKFIKILEAYNKIKK